MTRRERHGRGLRGPLSRPNPFTGRAVPLPQRGRGSDYFAWCVAESARRIQRQLPGALDGIEVGFEDVPTLSDTWQERVPLAAAATEPGRTRLVLYRRPLEHRAPSRRELATLVHRTVVEQLSALTGIPASEIDPGIDTEG